MSEPHRLVGVGTFDETKIKRDGDGQFAAKPAAAEAGFELSETGALDSAPPAEPVGRVPQEVRDLEVGDPVMVGTYGRPPRRMEVDAVGRKYVTVRGDRFDRETGRLAGQYDGTLITMAQHEEQQRRSAAVADLREFDVSVASSTSLTSRQLRAIVEIARNPS